MGTRAATAFRSLLALLAILCLPGRSLGQIDENQFQSDVKFLASLDSRSPGTDGYFKAADYVERQIRALGNVQWQKHSYPVMAPITDSATLTLPDGKIEKIYPFWPAGVRVCATPVEGIKGQLVYCKDALLKEIHPAVLNGQIAVLESTSGDNWIVAVNLGAKAIIILGTAQTNNMEMRAHDLEVPVNLPRFYVPPGRLADQLRAGAIRGQATLKASITWRRVLACNYYALVKSPGLIAGWSGTPPAALGITVPFDAGCLVPDLDPGASLAVQTASGLALLRDVSRHPLARPVLFCFTGCDSIAFWGSRNMHMALSDVPSNWTGELSDLQQRQQVARGQLDRLSAVLAAPQNLDILQDRALIQRLVSLVETQTMFVQDQLFEIRAMPAGDKTPRMQQRQKELEARQELLSRVGFAFKSQPSTLAQADLAEEAHAVCLQGIERLGGSADGTTRGLIGDYADRQADLRRRIELYHWLAQAEGRPCDPSPTASNVRLIELLVGLDLTDRGDRVGPMYFGRFASSSTIADIEDYGEWFQDPNSGLPGQAEPPWFKAIEPILDLEPLNSALAPTSWTPGWQSIPTEMGQAWGVPSLSFITLDDLRLARDTPADTLDKITFPGILRQLDAIRVLLRHAWNDPRFKGPEDPHWQRTTVTGQVVSAAPGRPVPDLPRGGFLMTYFHTWNDTDRISLLQWASYSMGNRRMELQPCDANGNYRFEGLWKLGGAQQQIIAVHAFRMDPGTGVVTGCTNLGSEAGDISAYANYGANEVDPLRSLVFDCVEFSLAGLYDPRYLQALTDVLPLDARRNDTPQKFDFLIMREMLAGFVEPNSRLYLLFRYGRVGNRLILVNMPKVTGAQIASSASADELGSGFTPEQINQLGLLSLVTARDFWRIDALRLAKYAEAGVVSHLLDALHEQAGQQIEQARKLAQMPGADAQAVVTNAIGAWANEARVYYSAQDMANDVIHAAIFLLLLCVPFSFCMERLLIGTPNVYKQIAGMSAIFFVMTLALWSFHPAFKISSSPLIIILAFAIIFMSIVVIAVVYGKFNTELKRLSSGRGVIEGASIAKASILMSAVLLGIANMRKRKFRTMLTSVTIVLITFAVLCFTSTSQYLATSRIPTGIASRYAGLLIRERGFRGMSEQLLMNVRAALDELYRREGRSDRPTVVQRWWDINPYNSQDYFHILAHGRSVAVQGMLGLSPGESQLTGIAQVIGEKKFALLENDPAARVIYFSAPIAEQLGVKEGQTVQVGGIDLTVAGIFDADSFDRNMTLLSGEPIAPIQYSVSNIDVRGRRLGDTNADDISLDAQTGELELSNAYDHLRATQFAIIPGWLAKLLPYAHMTSLGVKLAPDLDSGDQQVKQVSDDLSQRFNTEIFAGFKDGVQMVIASNLTSVSGAAQVAIPLAIAGLIIFNTMMGSIAERRREIYVYTSLGLAPFHVGALFVAEAMTYGLIGAVFGYIIGQGAGTAMLKLGWLGNTTLNYSGSSAILTMGLILLIVLLSALAPARLASKIAAPSIERTWKVPPPKGDEILAVLPFTINQTAAQGVLAYLNDFFDAHHEGSIGKFSAGKVDVFAIPGDGGRISRGLKTIIWLTPFDLGVRQHMMLLIHPGAYEDIYEVQLVLNRLSGNDRSWHRMNRTFLTEVRKQFLQWRTLTPQRIGQYVEMSRELFAAEGQEAGA